MTLGKWNISNIKKTHVYHLSNSKGRELGLVGVNITIGFRICFINMQNDYLINLFVQS